MATKKYKFKETFYIFKNANKLKQFLYG